VSSVTSSREQCQTNRFLTQPQLYTSSIRCHYLLPTFKDDRFLQGHICRASNFSPQLGTAGLSLSVEIILRRACDDLNLLLMINCMHYLALIRVFETCLDSFYHVLKIGLGRPKNILGGNKIGGSAWHLWGSLAPPGATWHPYKLLIVWKAMHIGLGYCYNGTSIHATICCANQYMSLELDKVLHYLLLPSRNYWKVLCFHTYFPKDPILVINSYLSDCATKMSN
jgi:hypothetical protein